MLDDKKNNILTEGDEYIYFKNEEKIQIYGNVVLNDKKNNILTEGKEFIYFRNEEKILSVGKSKSHIKFFLIALCINKATTLLSTPPDKAHITLSFFTLSFISLINLFF